MSPPGWESTAGRRMAAVVIMPVPNGFVSTIAWPSCPPAMVSKLSALASAGHSLAVERFGASYRMTAYNIPAAPLGDGSSAGQHF